MARRRTARDEGLRRCTRGATAVEFALVLPVLLVLVFGIIEFGRVLWVQNTLQYAAERGTRFYIVNAGAAESEIADVVRANLTGLNPPPDGLRIEARTETTVQQRTYKAVSVEYDFQFIVPVPALADLTLTAQARLPVPVEPPEQP